MIFTKFKQLSGTYLLIAFFFGFVAGGYVVDNDVSRQLSAVSSGSVPGNASVSGSAGSVVDEVVSSGPSDTEIMSNPANFTGEQVTVSGSLDTIASTVNDRNVDFLRSGGSKIEVQGCGLGDEVFKTVEFRGEVGFYEVCECQAKDGYGNWQDRDALNSYRTVRECEESRSAALGTDMRCEPGTQETRHYVMCKEKLSTEY